jgi:hypothetical protein
LDRRLSGAQSLSGRRGEDKVLDSTSKKMKKGREEGGRGEKPMLRSVTRNIHR